MKGKLYMLDVPPALEKNVCDTMLTRDPIAVANLYKQCRRLP